MVVLIDANIIMDFLMKREPYAEDAIRIVGLCRERILAALGNEKFTDFEDCLQEECAVEASADYIVTRNPKDFSGSRVKVISPGELLGLLQ